jgi:hypothetical protein
MANEIAGTWHLKTWKRHLDDDTTVHPLGLTPHGILIYTPGGDMAVQMVVAERPRLDTEDPVGGDVEQRAQAYSTCLSYFGTYEVRDGQVVHHVDAALFPNWSNTTQARPFVFDDGDLILQVKDGNERVTNEMIWTRTASSQ